MEMHHNVGKLLEWQGCWFTFERHYAFGAEHAHNVRHEGVNRWLAL